MKKLLVPTENDEGLDIDYSFGIFLGFDVEITEEETQMDNSAFRELIKTKIEQTVRGLISKINDRIKKTEFVGYNFYVYIVPFSDLANKRKDIIAQLKG